MKITMTPPIRTAFERASIEGVYRNRLMDLFQGEANFIASYLAFERSKHQYGEVMAEKMHFTHTAFVAIARIEALSALLPSERMGVSFEYEV